MEKDAQKHHRPVTAPADNRVSCPWLPPRKAAPEKNLVIEICQSRECASGKSNADESLARDKLLKLTAGDIGTEIRADLAAGIAQFYEPEN